MTKKIVLLFVLVIMRIYAHAGLFYEHKFIGDSAFKKFITINHLEKFFHDSLHFPRFGENGLNSPFAADNPMVSYYPGMFAIPGTDAIYSYGDFTGLGGDHTVDFIQLYQALLTTGAFEQLARNPRYKKLYNQARCALNSHRVGIDKGNREGKFVSAEYAVIAIEDRGHFQRPPKSFGQMLQLLDTCLLKKVYKFNITAVPDSAGACRCKPYCKKHPYDFDCLRKGVDNRLLHLNNASKYALLHLWAEQEIRAAAYNYYNRDTQNFANHFKAALVINAFADHFLQDAFASGHMAVQRNLSGLDNKGVHDFYCRVGINVQNSDTLKETGQPSRWTTYGDGHEDCILYEHAIDANVQSLQEVWGWFQKHLAAFNAGKPQLARLSLMAQNPQTQSQWADTLLANFRAYKYMPVPIDSQTYKDSIKLKRGSKNGFYYEATGSLVFSPNSFFHNYMASAAFGILGLNLVKPGSLLPGNFAKSIESVVWGGLGLNYNYYHHRIDEHRIYVTVNTTFLEYIAFDAGVGCSITGKETLPYEYLAAGAEYKSLKCRVAPSLKYFVEFEKHTSIPYMGLRLGLRIY